jgi:shikimate dehydrogenase
MISLGLAGYPLDHSLSPGIHNKAMQQCNLEGQYLLYPIAPNEFHELGMLLDQVRDGSIQGLNVTIPHKQNVIQFLDELTPVARIIGAVNTIYMKVGKLMGDNTDAPGFSGDLGRILGSEYKKNDLSKKALVLGAGGSARAVVFTLAHEGWQVIISSRRPEQAENLISQFSGYSLELRRADFDGISFRPYLSDLCLIVNTTPVGMSPASDKSPWPEGIPFPLSAVIYDLVYNPRETKFIRDARSTGLRACNGLGMLVEQAALSFKIWTGIEVSRESLFEAVEEE